MTITEIRDALTQLIDSGYGHEFLYDENDQHFAVCDIAWSTLTWKIIATFDEVK